MASDNVTVTEEELLDCAQRLKASCRAAMPGELVELMAGWLDHNVLEAVKCDRTGEYQERLKQTTMAAVLFTLAIGAEVPPELAILRVLGK